MLTLYKFEGKNKDELKEKYLKELQVNEEELFINETEEAGKLFKSKKMQVEIVKKTDIIKFVKEYLKVLSTSMNIEINSEIKFQGDILKITLVSNNNSILIGKEGRTLSAIQQLIRNSINNQIHINLKVNVDASNYKANKQKNLEFQIKKIIKEVLNTKVDVKLDPMNSYERRCIHNLVSNYKELESNSFGEDPERYIVISYKKNGDE